MGEFTTVSIAANTVTTIIGYIFAGFTSQWWQDPMFAYFGQLGSGEPLPAIVIVEILALLVASILIEGAILNIVNIKASKSDIWITAIFANIVSYAVGIMVPAAYLAQNTGYPAL